MSLEELGKRHEAYSRLGFAKLERLSAEDLKALADLFLILDSGAGLRLGGEDSRVARFTLGETLLGLAEQLLGGEAKPVRAILFQKARDANWLVPWHQDVTLACAEQFDADGYENWTRKDGMWHVQPPVWVLARMIALRVHLDDCGPDDGPLRVIPETHKLGKLSGLEIDRLVAKREAVTLTAKAGEILAMHPLTLHSSPKATGDSRRRVLHIEYLAAAGHPSFGKVNLALSPSADEPPTITS